MKLRARKIFEPCPLVNGRQIRERGTYKRTLRRAVTSVWQGKKLLVTKLAMKSVQFRVRKDW